MVREHQLELVVRRRKLRLALRRRGARSRQELLPAVGMGFPGGSPDGLDMAGFHVGGIGGSRLGLYEGHGVQRGRVSCIAAIDPRIRVIISAVGAGLRAHCTLPGRLVIVRRCFVVHFFHVQLRSLPQESQTGAR
mmetsp:Transcript_75562/g.196549  ORF Transcript_75562/g.196549 Transcript_75562/m.196549 type:complete len:135 (+) Transcript_75562:384-788(+)